MPMNIVWPVFLVTWIVVFCVLEGYALLTGNETLSVYIRNLGSAWPWLPYAYVVVAGVLAVHFWVQVRKG